MKTSASPMVCFRHVALATCLAAGSPAPGQGQIAAGFPSLPQRSPYLDPGTNWPADRTWDLGELAPGQSYGGEITLTNLCGSPRPVSLFVTGVPSLVVPLEVTVPAGGRVELPYLFDVPSGGGNVTGQLAVWAPAGPDPNCPASRITYQLNASVVQDVGGGGTRDDLSQVDRLDRYDYDGDGNFDEPDGYIDELDTVEVGEGDRGYSYADYFRRFQRAENARVESSRQARLDYWRSELAREESSGGTQHSLGVSPPSRPTPVETWPIGSASWWLALRDHQNASRRPLAIASAAVNPASMAAAGVDDTAQHVVSVLTLVEKAPVYASRGSPFRVLAGWLRPAAPRFSIASGLRAPAWMSRQEPAAASPATAPDDLLVYVTSAGALGAGALRAVLVNGTGRPITLGKSVAVLEPLARLTARDVERELETLSHLPQRAVALDGYCLERLKAAPAAGTVFRLAAPGARASFAPVAGVLESARRLRDQKAFSADTDPEDYYHSIVQWAIWADRERFDEKAFAAAFAAYTKKNVIAAGAKWTRDMDAAVAEIAPNRWRDVSRIVQAARAAPGAPTGK